MQAALSDLGRAERTAAQAAADAAAARVFNGAIALAVATLVGVAATIAILLLFVRNGVLRPIEALSGDLSRIARGETGAPVPVRGRSEIAEMARAVEVFRTSVEDLHSTHRALSQEVAERRRAVERLELTQRELVQAGKMAALGQMSAAISHEINQPLAAMRHMLHALERKHPDARAGLERIGAMIDRIAATIGHLRRISRRADHRSVRVPLSAPLDAALALLDHRLRGEGVAVAVAETVESLAVQGDDILLEQVLLNVLGNALDAIAETGRGGGHIRIDLLDGPEPVLRITDDGVGLGGRSGADLIDPFFTTKDVGRGLGLGLSIAFNVMQDMGGHLDIGPGEAGGAVVTLRLCRWPEPMSAHV
jgi:C4-dicarboxylate-specific signal transduction histidine kinase